MPRVLYIFTYQMFSIVSWASKVHIFLIIVEKIIKSHFICRGSSSVVKVPDSVCNDPFADKDKLKCLTINFRHRNHIHIGIGGPVL